MSASRRNREREAQPKGETYSRADEALWDDEYLLKLFNEQLENPAAVSATAQEEDDQSSMPSISETKSETAAQSASAGSQTFQSSNSFMDGKAKHKSAKSAVVPAASVSTLANLQLPADIHVLIQSFYNAGFEAGRYVGRTEAKEEHSRKRHRE